MRAGTLRISADLLRERMMLPRTVEIRAAACSGPGQLDLVIVDVGGYSGLPQVDDCPEALAAAPIVSYSTRRTESGRELFGGFHV